MAVNAGATGIGLAIYETNNILLPLNKKSLLKTLATGETTIEFNFVAKYMATVPAAPMTAGAANSTVHYRL